MSQPDLLNRPDFASFYERYPRKKAPKDAKKAYGQALKEVSAEHLQAAVEAYRALWDEHIKKLDAKARKAAKLFLPYPGTWLRAGDYDDEDIQEYLARPNEKIDGVLLKEGEPGFKGWIAYEIAQNPSMTSFYQNRRAIVVPTPFPPGDE